MSRGTLALALEGPTAEERRRDSLERVAMIRSRTEADRQYRERAAVGLEAAKRDKVGREEGGGGAVGTVRARPGRMKKVLPGPPGIYSVIGTRVEALGLAAVAQISNVRREVQMGADNESAGREVVMTAANQTAVATGMAECRPAMEVPAVAARHRARVRAAGAGGETGVSGGTSRQ